MLAGIAALLLPVSLANPYPRPLAVEYRGCSEVSGPRLVCETSAGNTLTFWIPKPASANPPEIRVNGRVTAAAMEEAEGGLRLAVTVPEGYRWVAVRVPDRESALFWLLPLKRSPSPPEWMNQAWHLISSGRVAEARVLIDQQIPTVHPAFLGQALSWRAHLSSSLSGEEERLGFLRRAVDARKRAGQILWEANEAATLAWSLIGLHRFVEARQLLASLHLPPGEPAKAGLQLTYSRGLLACATGDARQALVDLEAARRLAERVGLELEAWQASEELAIQLSHLGRFAEAHRLFEALKDHPPPHLDANDIGDLLTNYGWALYQAREAGEEADDPTSLFTQARLSFLAAPRKDPHRQYNAALNLALAALSSHHVAEAKKAFAAAAPLGFAAQPIERFWALDLQGRIALEEGRPAESLALYDRLEMLAAAALSPADQWRAAYGKAGAYDALGNQPAAIAALSGAERLVDAQVARIPVQEGRESFVDLWEKGSRRYVDLLLRAGRNEEALLVARRARARVLRQLASYHRPNNLNAAQQAGRDRALSEYLDQRRQLDREIEASSWFTRETGPTPSADRAARLQALQRLLDRALLTPLQPGAIQEDLPAPRPGELILAYFPLPRGWVGFVADSLGVDAHPFADLPESTDSERQAEVLLQPFRASIARAQRLRILPYGKLRTVEFHALPWDGGTLLGAKPVVYGLDLGMRTAPRSSSPPRALIVSDPRSNLPISRREADDVESALSSWRPRWSVERLQGAEATREAVLRQMSHSALDLLHYAGHAGFSGRGGWDSALLLGQGSRFTLGDVLTLDPAPRWVVLFGCETGREDPETQVESQGLAQAFLLAGSEVVIASTRKIHDSVGRRLAAALYRQASSFADPATLVQRALLAEQHRLPQKEWASFRVFEP